MPVYNAGRYLDESITSVLSQSMRSLELIIVDDVSTDDSLAVARRYAQADSRVKVIALERNGGPGIARNRGIDAARGEFVGFLDADDYLIDGALEKLTRFATDENLDFARGSTSWFTVDDPTLRSDRMSFDRRTVFTSAAELKGVALCIFSIPPRPDDPDLSLGGAQVAALFRRSLLEEFNIRFTEKPHAISEDLLFNFKVAVNARRIGVIPDAYYAYRRSPLSRSNYPVPDVIDRALDSAARMEQMIKEAGFAERDLEYAMRYAIDISRAYLKNFFLSDMPRAELREWFHLQRRHPYLQRVATRYPLRYLPLMHRIGFRAFYGGRFALSSLLIKGREWLRDHAGMQTKMPTRR